MAGRRRFVHAGCAVAGLTVLTFGATPALGASSIPVPPSVDLQTEADFQVDGADAGDGIGRSLGVANVVGPGRPGIVIGAGGNPPPGLAADDPPPTPAPRTLAVGVAGQPPTLLDLASATTGVFRVRTAADAFAATARPVGDVNGDGVDDLAVMARRGNPRVIFGGGRTNQVDADGIGPDGLSILGLTIPTIGLDAEFEVVGIGDQNGDGRDDLLVASSADVDQVWVVFGAAGGSVDVRALGPGGYAISRGPSVLLGHTGSVGSAGDVNGDGVVDLLVAGRPLAATTGQVFVIHGKANTTPVNLGDLGPAGYRIIPGDLDFTLDRPIVTAAGDVNGDGVGDHLIGGIAGSLAGEPAAAVVFGSPTRTEVDLSALGARGFLITRAESFAAVWPLAGGRDVDGDGRGDLLLGASDGRTHLVYGKPGGRDLNLGGSPRVLRFDGPSGSGAGASAAFGAVRRGGSDILIGAPFNDANGRENSGSVYGVTIGRPPRQRLAALSISRTSIDRAGSGTKRRDALLRFRTRTRMTIRVTFVRELAGVRTASGRCARTTRRVPTLRRCTRDVTAGTLRKLQRRAGRGTLRISSRIGRRSLARGRYRLRIEGIEPRGRTWGPALRDITVR